MSGRKVTEIVIVWPVWAFFGFFLSFLLYTFCIVHNFYNENISFFFKIEKGKEGREKESKKEERKVGRKKRRFLYIFSVPACVLSTEGTAMNEALIPLATVQD